MREMLANFDGYTLRPVLERDRAALEAWLAADDCHNGLYEPEHFMGLEKRASGELAADPRANCYAMEDAKGTLFFIRLSRASRVAIQFDTASTESKRRRVAMALLKGMAYLEVMLAKAGAEEWIFETWDQGLAEMARHRLGFRDSPDEMVRAIERPKEEVQ